MKKIIFIGDSLTWGTNPDTGKRWTKENRWTTLVKNSVKEREVVSFGIPGMAIRYNSWSDEVDWDDAQHLFIERVLRSFAPDFDDLFLFMGANDLNSKPNGHKVIKQHYQELIDSIRERTPCVENIYVILLANMPKMTYKPYSIKEFNEELKHLKNVNGFIELDSVDVISKDCVHFTKENNEQVANIIVKFIENKCKYK